MKPMMLFVLLATSLMLSSPSVMAENVTVASLEATSTALVRTSNSIFGNKNIWGVGAVNKKWTTALSRANHETTPETVLAFVNDVSALEKDIMISAVNDFFNKFKYIEEKRGQDDWKTLKEFVKDGGGDCEDYAVAKYQTFKLLGIDPNDMIIVIAKDRYVAQTHVVLAIKNNNKWLILDNKGSAMLEASRIRNTIYKGIYGVSENQWVRFIHD